MAVKIRRSYKGAAVAAVLDSSGVTSATQTAIALSTSPSTWPTGKFFVVVAPGTAQEEKMCVTVSGSTLTVVDPAVSSTAASANGRGVDNTTARSTIAGGATVYPVFTAVDADEANELTSTYANQGGIVYQGASTFAQLGIGTAAQVLKVNSGATAPEWGQVATAGIADSAVTSAKIADGTIVLADLAAALQAFLVPVGTIAMYGGASAPTGWLLCDGTSTTGYTALAAIVGANTPDLRGRFAIGDNASLTLLGTGGSATIAEANLPSHTHANTATASTSVTVNSGGGHSHTASSGTAGAHSHTASTSSTGNHDHPQTVESTSITGDTHTHGTTGTAGNPDQTNSTGTDYTGSAGNHSHTVTVDEVVGHSHTVTVDEGGSHSHSTSATTTVTMSNASVGSGTAYYQPYLVVNYIIKHD